MGIAVVIVLVAANVATNLLPQRWYLPVCLLSTAVLLVLARLDGLTATDLGLGGSTLLSGLAWAALIASTVCAGYATVGALPRGRAAFSDRRAMESRGADVARRVLVTIPLGTVLLEETAFRGVLFAMLFAARGSAAAVAVTSVLFGLWHVLPARAMHASHEAVRAALGSGQRGGVLALLFTVLLTTAGGVVFAMLRVWSGSLLPPAGLHWALNGAGFALAWWLARTRGQGAHGRPA